MGGLVIILSVLLSYALAKLITQDAPSWSGLLLLFLLVGLGSVGFLDDYSACAARPRWPARRSWRWCSRPWR
jgi:UDP-N-acetylmuramyl pentapeptide phosphotransferase/UDP-N-acetylglucosamine-1-phosphate transferase